MHFDVLMQTSTPMQYNHDPGGKTRLRIKDEIASTILLSECGRYRPLLLRIWNDRGPQTKTALFIGMNPSTADAHWDCPTCSKERIYARDILGVDGYIKCNIMDYRATDPTLLLRTPDPVCSDMNFQVIRDNIERATIVVLCTGNLNHRFVPLMKELADILKNSGREVFCFGHNASGYTKHPLYLLKTTPLVPVDWAWINKAPGTPY